jgi:hypothetical protein
MTSYLGLHKAAFADIGLLYPSIQANLSWSLRTLTEAVSEYQSATGAVQCQTRIDLLSGNTSGEYQMPQCIMTVTLAEYRPYDTASPSRIQIITQESLERLKGSMGNFPQQMPVPNPSQLMYITYNDYTVSVYPPNIPGVITLYYKPLLSPFWRDAPEWAKAPDQGTKEFEEWMNTIAPPREFGVAESGLKSYLMAKIMPRIPNYMNLFPGLREEMLATFEYGKRKILRANPPLAVDRLIIPPQVPVV